MKSTKKYKWLGGIFFMVVVILLVLHQYGYRYNATPSYPVGFYKVNTADNQIRRGKLVLVCPPDTKAFKEANKKSYIHKGFCPSGYQPLIKKIAGVPGDRIIVDRFVYINGIKQPKSRVYDVDPQGYKLAHTPKKEYHLGSNQIFLLSDYNDKSFDSRYFGPVNTNLIQGAITPVKVW